MPALITGTGQHASTRRTVRRIEEGLARPGQRAGTLPALTAGGGEAIRDCRRGSDPYQGRGRPIGRLIDAQPLIQCCGPAWVPTGGNLIAGIGKALTVLKPSEGPRG